MGMEKVICEAAAVNSAIETIADAIIKDFCSDDKIEEFALAGLFKQGVPLSHRIAKIIDFFHRMCYNRIRMQYPRHFGIL